jgi:hypothetical protein
MGKAVSGRFRVDLSGFWAAAAGSAALVVTSGIPILVAGAKLRPQRFIVSGEADDETDVKRGRDPEAYSSVKSRSNTLG